LARRRDSEEGGEPVPSGFKPPPGAQELADLTGREPTADVRDPTKVGVIPPGTLRAETVTEAKKLAEETGKQVYITSGDHEGEFARADGEVGAYQPL
jgi:hypothetical protein